MSWVLSASNVSILRSSVSLKSEIVLLASKKAECDRLAYVVMLDELVVALFGQLEKLIVGPALRSRSSSACDRKLKAAKLA